MKTSPRNKATGVDEITTEAILACGGTGMTWLTAIFKKAWKERKVPEDWQRAVLIPIWKNLLKNPRAAEYVQGGATAERREGAQMPSLFYDDKARRQSSTTEN